MTHIVIFSWRPGVTPAQTRGLGEALDRLAIELRELGEIRHGPDLGFREGNGDYALVARFADRAGWDAYQAHPAHKAFVQDVVAPIQASRLTIQLQDEARPQ